MAKKVYIQPGVWVILIVIAMAGLFFGINALKRNGMLGKVTNAIAPTGKASSDVKVVKIKGQRPLVVAVNTG